MTTPYNDIQRAFEKRLEAFRGMPDTRVAYENVKFSPPDPGGDNGWAQAFFSPQAIRRTGLGEGGFSRIDGSFQVILNYPRNTGSGPVREVADGLAAWFRSGTRLQSGQVSVTCSAARRAPALPHETWYRVPVAITWYAHTTDL